MDDLTYAVLVEPLPISEGGGYLASVPDLPGCMSDGETPEEAIANVRDAIACWIEAAKELGRAVPPPSRAKAVA
ncbi:type II toxin-antitoxin system HicB family antitoxin [Bosea caraganae]|uniref:Type II toxin-antitoxin system HicB family antitoxin n=1 Tax=Bosea caraganae TaxID=2763117 RepID=A0A370KY02_9HYPH|nr:type II toxin-antitoxin system HicB family antitoxin [Bosea caraganae]RDJ19879.1 type II toxin-antitoxin system HicB family antitoxin [Bosea caraganae]RDJ25609.1 type II toxin-antitoxin system HicB family antitoxin [Bosea caraganae]